MNFTASYVKKVTNEEGNDELTFEVSGYFDKDVIKSLEKETMYRITCTKVKSKRTIEQNAYMWALIHEIGSSRGTNRANDDWEIYLEALERAGSKYEYIAVLPQAEEMLKQQFRAIKLMNQFEHKGKLFNSYKVYYGSSKMDKKEMAMLLETVLDMASEEGIELKEFDY